MGGVVVIPDFRRSDFLPLGALLFQDQLVAEHEMPIGAHGPLGHRAVRVSDEMHVHAVGGSTHLRIGPAQFIHPKSAARPPNQRRGGGPFILDQIVGLPGGGLPERQPLAFVGPVVRIEHPPDREGGFHRLGFPGRFQYPGGIEAQFVVISPVGHHGNPGLRGVDPSDVLAQDDGRDPCLGVADQRQPLRRRGIAGGAGNIDGQMPGVAIRTHHLAQVELEHRRSAPS